MYRFYTSYCSGRLVFIYITLHCSVCSVVTWVPGIALFSDFWGSTCVPVSLDLAYDVPSAGVAMLWCHSLCAVTVLSCYQLLLLLFFFLPWDRVSLCRPDSLDLLCRPDWSWTWRSVSASLLLRLKVCASKPGTVSVHHLVYKLIIRMCTWKPLQSYLTCGRGIFWAVRHQLPCTYTSVLECTYASPHVVGPSLHTHTDCGSR